MSKGTRQIKCLGNSIETNEFYLHPITLALIKNVNKDNKKIAPSELHYDKDGKSRYYKIVENEILLSNKDIQTFMALPYLNISIEQMLKIYNIDSNDPDSIMKWVVENIENKKSFQYINRIINTWIKINYEELIINNKILVAIYKKLLSSTSSCNIKNIQKLNLEQLIDDWLKKNNSNNFEFNLGKYLCSLY
jgi:hypothetical protein